MNGRFQPSLSASAIVAVALLFAANQASDAFTMPAAPLPSIHMTTRRSSSNVVLGMGKGLNKARNKQADLKRRLELAKQQKEGGSSEESNDTNKAKTLSDSEIKERNDRLRFEQLLQRDGSKVLNDYSSDGYLNKNQEEEEITAASKSHLIWSFVCFVWLVNCIL